MSHWPNLHDGARIAFVCGVFPIVTAVMNLSEAPVGLRLGFVAAGLFLWTIALCFMIAGRKAERSEGSK